MSVSQMPAVRLALRRLIQDPASWPVPNLLVLRNLLLDACGGDARPLVALLVRAAEFSIPVRLLESGTAPEGWERLRGVLTITLVADGFLQQEWAVWAVEAWAYGLGVIEEEQVKVGISSPTSAAPAMQPPKVSPRLAPRSRTSPPHAATRPRWSAQAAPLSASASSAPLPPVVPFALHTRRAQAIAAVVALAAVVPVLYLGRELRSRRTVPSLATSPAIVAGTRPDTVPGAELARSSAGTSAVPRAGIPSITMGALPAPRSPEDVRRVVPPTRPGVGSDPARYPPAYTTYTAAPLDRILLRGGRELTGRVEVVRASTVQFRDGESGLRYEFPKPDIIEITTEFGTKVRFEPNGTPSNDRGEAAGFISGRLAGTYQVRYGSATVHGSRECAGLWNRPPEEDRVQVEHRAGADTVTLGFVGGGKFTAVVDNAGRFATSVVIVPDQALTSSAITTRLEGRFRANGFDAVVHMLAFRRGAADGENDVACQSDIPATGATLPGGGPR